MHDWGLPSLSVGGVFGTLPDPLAELAPHTQSLQLLNFASSGKRLVAEVPVRSSGDRPAARHHVHEAPPAKKADTDRSHAIEVRAGTADDAEAIAQLLYQNYHLSYVHADFYRPRIPDRRVRDRRAVVGGRGARRSSGRAPRTDAAPRYSVGRDRSRSRPLRLSRPRSVRPDVRAHARRGGRARLRVGLRRCRHDSPLQPARRVLARLPRDGAPARHAPGADHDAWLRQRRASTTNGHPSLVPSPRRRSPGKPRCRLRTASSSNASTRMSGSRSRPAPGSLRFRAMPSRQRSTSRALSAS